MTNCTCEDGHRDCCGQFCDACSKSMEDAAHAAVEAQWFARFSDEERHDQPNHDDR